MDGTPARVKGATFNTLLRSLAQLYGANNATRCIEACPPPLREALTAGMAPASWYPVAWHRELQQAIAHTLHTGAEQATEISANATMQDLTTLHRLAALFFSPQTLVKQSTRLLRFYFDGARVEIVDSGPGFAHIRVEGLNGFDHLCWAAFLGGSTAALECAGAAEPAYRILRGGNEDGEVEVRFSWREM